MGLHSRQGQGVTAPASYPPGPITAPTLWPAVLEGFLLCQQPGQAPAGPAVPQTARQTRGFAVGSARCLNGSAESPPSLAWLGALPVGPWAVQSDTPGL